MHFACWYTLTIVFLILSARCCSGITCYKCDSVTLPDCATSLDSDSLPYEECKSATACAMTIVDSITYRGCSSNTPRGPDYYKSCPENLCNKGVYPPGRLKCHQCAGGNCLSAPTSKPTPCLYFYEKDYCYTDVIDEIDAYRGCYSDGNRTVNMLAELCDINGCNNQPGLITLTCSKCDSSEARGCKMDLFEVNNASCLIKNETTCSVKSLLGHESGSCFLYHNLHRVVRGCSSDSGTLELDVAHYDTCETDLCNQKCLKQQKCIVCDSNKDERCKSDPSSLTASTCPSAEVSSCNSCQLADGSVQRGCGPPTATQGSSCNQCDGEGCNRLSFTKCYKCTSNESPNCAQWANPNIIDVETCEISGAKCISAVFPNGRTLRGCESPYLTCNGTQTNCARCSGDLCNSGVYPALRLQCHYCDGRDQCSEVMDERNLRPCATYTENDACFEFVSGRGTMVRGCLSDSTLYYECLLADKCRLCDGPGCNMMPAKQNAQLQCHKCSANSETCSWQQGSESLVQCSNDVEFMIEETCYTRHYPNGSTSRGCTLDDGLPSEENVLYSTCSLDGCNERATIVQRCLQCRDSKTTVNPCTKNLNTAVGLVCNEGLVAYGERGCYTKIDASYVERGCLLSMTEIERAACNSDEHCHLCQGIDCNVEIISNFMEGKSASCNKASLSIGLTIIMVILKLFE